MATVTVLKSNTFEGSGMQGDVGAKGAISVPMRVTFGDIREPSYRVGNNDARYA